jgi:hypothetical protein
MRRLFRTALLSAMTLLFVPPATPLVGSAFAATTRTDRKTTKKKREKKYNSKKLILKGHHGKHKGRPA